MPIFKSRSDFFKHLRDTKAVWLKLYEGKSPTNTALVYETTSNKDDAPAEKQTIKRAIAHETEALIKAVEEFLDMFTAGTYYTAQYKSTTESGGSKFTGTFLNGEESEPSNNNNSVISGPRGEFYTKDQVNEMITQKIKEVEQERYVKNLEIELKELKLQVSKPSELEQMVVRIAGPLEPLLKGLAQNYASKQIGIGSTQQNNQKPIQQQQQQKPIQQQKQEVKSDTQTESESNPEEEEFINELTVLCEKIKESGNEPIDVFKRLNNQDIPTIISFLPE